MQQADVVASHAPSPKEFTLKTKKKTTKLFTFIWAGLHSKCIAPFPFISLLQGFPGFDSNRGGACLPVLSLELCRFKIMRALSEMQLPFPSRMKPSYSMRRPKDNNENSTPVFYKRLGHKRVMFSFFMESCDGKDVLLASAWINALLHDGKATSFGRMCSLTP